MKYEWWFVDDMFTKESWSSSFETFLKLKYMFVFEIWWQSTKFGPYYSENSKVWSLSITFLISYSFKYSCLLSIRIWSAWVTSKRLIPNHNHECPRTKKTCTQRVSLIRCYFALTIQKLLYSFSSLLKWLVE